MILLWTRRDAFEHELLWRKCEVGAVIIQQGLGTSKINLFGAAIRKHLRPKGIFTQWNTRPVCIVFHMGAKEGPHPYK